MNHAAFVVWAYIIKVNGDNFSHSSLYNCRQRAGTHLLHHTVMDSQATGGWAIGSIAANVRQLFNKGKQVAANFLCLNVCIHFFSPPPPIGWGLRDIVNILSRAKYWFCYSCPKIRNMGLILGICGFMGVLNLCCGLMNPFHYLLSRFEI